MPISKSKYSSVKSLLQKKFREQEGKFIIEGWKSVEEAVGAGIKIESVLYQEDKIPEPKLFARIKKASQECLEVSAKEISSLSDTVTSQGIVAVIPKLSSLHDLATLIHKEEARIVVLDDINDPGNLGTIVRLCDWFNIDSMVISKNSVELYNPKVVRATMGSIFHLPIIENTDLVAFLRKSKNEGFTIYSTESNEGTNVHEIHWANKSIIVIGNESHGISAEVSHLSDFKTTIPRFGKAESLNAAIACGIILSQIKLR